MKALIALTLFSLSAMATCPQAPHNRPEIWKLYPEDTVRELHHCKSKSTQGLKLMEFCVGRLSSSMTQDYIGIGGIMEYAEPELAGRLYSIPYSWISLVRDQEGEAEDSLRLMSFIHKPTPSIMAHHQYKYTFSLDKKSGDALYQMERKNYPCILCGGWKPYKSATLKCKLIQ